MTHPLWGESLTPHHLTHLEFFQPEDAQSLFDLIEENREHLLQAGEPIANRYPSYQSVLATICQDHGPNWYRYGIWWDEDLVGVINLARQLANPQRLEIGYWLGLKFCGLGIARIAVRRAINIAFLFKKPPTQAIFARVNRSNIPSINVLNAVSFRLESETDKELWFVYERDRYFGSRELSRGGKKIVPGRGRRKS